MKREATTIHGPRRSAPLAPLLALAAGLIVFAGGCKNEKAGVGFSQIGAESGWRTAETNSVTSEADKRGIKLKFSSAEGKQENQIQAMRNFISQQVEGIILAPVVKTGWEPVLKEAKAAKIPVVLVDRGITVEDDSLYATLIASDFVEEGRMAGRWLKDKTGGKCNIAELEGTPGADPAIERHKGFAEIVDQNPGMKIVAHQTGEFQRAKGREVMEAFLDADRKKPKEEQITAVYAHNDDMALGAIQALEAAGKKPGSDILVLSIDGEKEALQAMVDGKLNCTVGCDPLLGPAAFDAIQKAIKGEPLPKKTVVKDEIFDQSKAKDLIGGRKY